MAEPGAAMDMEQIRAILHAALPVRIPAVTPNEGARPRIEALNDYIVKTAEHRGALEEALHWTVEVEKALDREWDRVEGWEVHLPRGRDRTRENVAYAKRRIQPDTWDAKVEARTMKESIARQIRRFELDYEAASRSYTLMTGS